MAYIRRYVSHSCIRKHDRLAPLAIKTNESLFISGLSILAFATILIPHYASAFWPFSTNADAAVATSIPSGGTPALAAATNTDPNPNKGLGDTLQTSGEALVASSGPAGTIAGVAGTTAPGRISVYVVRPGDTLSDIATMFNVSVNTVVWANNLRSVRDVHPGDTLVILPVSGVEHKVVKGDTLRSLAKKYGADAEEIAQFNGLDPGSSLAVGATVIVPGGEISVPVVQSSGASAPRATVQAGGAFIPGYYGNPLPGRLVTQGIHGWNGIDIGAPRGTPIYAAASGVVVVVRSTGWNAGYGNYVVIQHGNGTQTLYAHNSRNAVVMGESVGQGQVIAYVGATGRSTGTHLHFEVRGAANPFRACRVGTYCSPI